MNPALAIARVTELVSRQARTAVDENALTVVRLQILNPPSAPASTPDAPQWVAQGDVGALKLVTAVADGVARLAQSTDPYPLGVTTTAAADGGSFEVVLDGVIADAFWNWTPGGVLFAADDGGLTQTPPEAGYLVSIGVALSATTIMVRIASPILRSSENDN